MWQSTSNLVFLPRRKKEECIICINCFLEGIRASVTRQALSAEERLEQRIMSAKRKVNLKETKAKSTDTARHFHIKRESIGNVSPRISDQIGATCNKLRSCSLGERGMSGPLLDLQNKSVNINGQHLVPNSVNIVKEISSSGEKRKVLTF